MYVSAQYRLSQTLQLHKRGWGMMLQVYELPNLHLEGKMCRTNLAPRTIVRGPGFLNAVMIMEQVTLIATQNCCCMLMPLLHRTTN